MAKTTLPNEGGPDSISGQETRAHMPQEDQRPQWPQLRPEAVK